MLISRTNSKICVPMFILTDALPWCRPVNWCVRPTWPRSGSGAKSPTSSTSCSWTRSPVSAIFAQLSSAFLSSARGSNNLLVETPSGDCMRRSGRESCFLLSAKFIRFRRHKTNARGLCARRFSSDELRWPAVSPGLHCDATRQGYRCNLRRLGSRLNDTPICHSAALRPLHLHYFISYRSFCEPRATFLPAFCAGITFIYVPEISWYLWITLFGRRFFWAKRTHSHIVWFVIF